MCACFQVELKLHSTLAPYLDSTVEVQGTEHFDESYDPYAEMPPKYRFMHALSEHIDHLLAAPVQSINAIEVEPLCGDGICSMEEVHSDEDLSFGTTCPLDCHVHGRCSMGGIVPTQNFTATDMDFTRVQGMQ